MSITLSNFEIFCLQGPDLTLNVVVRKTEFYGMQLKVQEVEELSARLRNIDSQQLSKRNPNNADLSDTHRPTELREMYGQLFDNEWSDAFEALRDSSIAKEGDDDAISKESDDDDEFYPDILSILKTLVEASSK
uniref:Uncharacterized protein n=1 Tax=Magallana gigas TaxID=29159 RepID=K1RK04_MAGGI